LNAFLDDLQLCAPLFALIGAGWLLARWPRWPASATAWLGKLVFSVALPALLFGMMSDLSRLPPVDWRVLLAFFGSCLIVFALGRWVAWRWFGMDGVAQSLFGLAGVFSNNALLGLPLAKLTLGDEALPTVALVLVFNSLTLWTLVTVSVEWARQGSLSLQGLGATVRSVLSNPLIIGILSGTAVGLSGWALPPAVRIPLTWVGDGAAPLALFTLGLGLHQHGIRAQWRSSLAMTGMKLLVQPLVVWGLAAMLGLGYIETRVVVLLGSIAVGANVYLMALHFKTLEGPVAASLVMSTGLSALSTPLLLALTA
jgi:predicted permease